MEIYNQQFLTIPATVPVREFISLVQVFDASHGHHHTENLSTAAAIEVMESVVRHVDFAFCLSTTKESRVLRFE